MNLNQVTIGGTLTRDPELRYTAKGTAVCELGIAINETWNDANGSKQERTTFVDVTFWGRTGEVIHQYFQKGGQILICGKLTLDTWEDKQSGQKRSKLKVTGQSFEFCNKNFAGDGQERQQRRQEAPTTRDVPQDDYEDNIPF